MKKRGLVDEITAGFVTGNVNIPLLTLGLEMTG